MRCVYARVSWIARCVCVSVCLNVCVCVLMCVRACMCICAVICACVRWTSLTQAGESHDAGTETESNKDQEVCVSLLRHARHAALAHSPSHTHRHTHAQAHTHTHRHTRTHTCTQAHAHTTHTHTHRYTITDWAHLRVMIYSFIAILLTLLI